MKAIFLRRKANVWGALLGALLALLCGCSTPPPPIASVEPPVVVRGPAASLAETPLAYRHDAAAHLYDKNSSRIFKGILPPFLYAVAVLQIEVDGLGQPVALNWMRQPLHAPEVVAEIERTVRLAAPFPAPTRLGRVSYIDTWLWDASGRFQLHTLTEGQSWVVSGTEPPGTARPQP
jgi:periplasmic protein TonB